MSLGDTYNSSTYNKWLQTGLKTLGTCACLKISSPVTDGHFVITE